MADPNSASQGAAKAAADAGAKAGASEANPVFKMMGLPNFRFKLPSRNWMIFLTVTGSWTAALVYDRRQKKRVQQGYCDAVAHLAREPLATNEMQRRMTVYLAGPPADGLMGAREHFIEYVKPILVAAAMDWEAVEGRREGDVRAQTAEKVRGLRKARGEASAAPAPGEEDEEEDAESVLRNTRARVGIKEWPGAQGDIVIGRNTWKEYVRGLHEGWLGPLDAPPPPSPPAPTPAEDAIASASSTASDDASPSVQQTPSEEEQQKPAEEQQQQQQKTEEELKKEEEEQKKKKKRAQPPPYNSLADYASAALSPNCPPQLGPSAPIAYPHILGFLNTPIRMWRFLNRRHLADEIGAQVAAAVLAANRPYAGPEAEFAEERVAPVGEGEGGEERWEQQAVLKGEEKEWHKSVRKEAAKKREEEGKESVWCDEMVVDPRIGGRMQRFVLSEVEKARVERINQGVEGVLGQEKKDEE